MYQYDAEQKTHTLNEWNYTETQCEKYHICSWTQLHGRLLNCIAFQRNTVFLGTTHLEICNISFNTYHCLKAVSLLRLCSPLTSLHHYLWPIFDQLTLDPGDLTNPGCHDTQLNLLCNTLIAPRQRPIRLCSGTICSLYSYRSDWHLLLFKPVICIVKREANRQV